MRSMLANFPTEIVRIIKSDSSVIESVRALVERNMIFIDDASINIEEGDIIERSLPSGAKEKFEVLDNGFQRGIHGISSHYQVKVRKCGIHAKKESKPIINQYNISNADKININSVDNSVNYHITANDIATMDALRAIAKGLDNEEQILTSIDEMQAAIGTKSFSEKYNTFIQNAANHMTLFAPFIPALTEVLKKCFA